MKLNNKIAVITGGSRGIGYAIVTSFLREGATVILTASSQASADKAVAKVLAEMPGAAVEGIGPDLTNMDAVKAAFAAIVEKYGRIDILVNNAGVSDSTPLANYTEETYDKVMDLNVKGVFVPSKVAAEYMAAQGSGVILNTSSMVSFCAQTSGFAYPTSKFALNGMTLSMARELAPKGIRVNAVAPGITETDMVKALPKQMIEPLIQRIPLRRLGQPEDIANAFVFLASEDASYISGVVLRVDGLMNT